MAVNKGLLLLNTSVSYIRTLVNIGFSLFSTRWLMNALGVEDYGLYAVVGGLIVFLTFINTALSQGAQRFFSHSMDISVDVVRKWFTISFCIHVVVATSVILLSIPAYFLFFNGLLSIPENRRAACAVVYWCSVVCSFGGIANVPFVAMYTAKQHIFELTLMGLIQTFGNFSLTYSLFFIKGDRLIYYAICALGISYLIFILQAIRSFCVFKESRLIKFSHLRRSDFKEMLSFSWWTFVDSFSFMLRGQAIQIVFNRFGTASLNAAYSVSNQLACQTNVLSGALVGAMSPGIMSQYGAGDEKGAGVWSLRTCRLATVLALLVFVPIYVECPTIMKLWLVNPPEYTTEFVRIIATTYLVTQFVTGGNTLIKSRGNIGKYEIWVSINYLLAIVFALAIVGLHVPTHYAVLGYLFSTIGYAMITIMLACKMPGFDFVTWFKGNLVFGLIVMGIALGAGYTFVCCMKPSLIRCFLVGTATSIVIGVFSWLLLLEKPEKVRIREKICEKLILLRGMRFI